MLNSFAPRPGWVKSVASRAGTNNRFWINIHVKLLIKDIKAFLKGEMTYYICLLSLYVSKENINVFYLIPHNLDLKMRKVISSSGAFSFTFLKIMILIMFFVLAV